MKRSTSVRLTLMGAATATSLAACDGEPPAPPAAFTTVQDCALGGFPNAECQTAYDDAQKAHLANAPRFASLEECRKAVDVDNCVETPVRTADGRTSNVFMPLMAGYLIGNLLNQRQIPPQQQQQSSSGYSGGGGGGRGAPLYRSREYAGTFRDGGNLATSKSGNTISAPSRPANINTTTISRSGFGSSSSSFGSGSS